MHKATVYILTLSILVQSFNFDSTDFYKIPDLASHFISHLNEGDSVLEFVSMHYGSLESTHKGDHKEHKDLPFKRHHIDSSFQFTYLISSNYIEIKAKEIITNSSNFFYKSLLPSLFHKFIFQPPQK